MSATPQSQMIAAANNLILIGQQLTSLKVLIDMTSATYTAQAMGTSLAHLATAAVNSDGSLGAADGSPVAANPIDTRLQPTLNRAISSYDLGALLTLYQQVSLLLAGSAAATQSGAPDLLANLNGG